MIFARWLFRIACLYGLIALVPFYFRAPPAEPVWYLGFAGAAGVMQLVYLLISIDPVRYRALMLMGVLSKLSFAIPCALLHAQGRIGRDLLVGGMIDLIFAILFAIAWLRTGKGLGIGGHRPT